MKTIRTLSLILLALFTLGSASALASDVGTASSKDSASVTTVAYRHRVRRSEWYRGRDGRWRRHYVYVYVW
jgi:hypothetical protein